MSQVSDAASSIARESAAALSSPRIWAILVGVNYYSGKADDLFGCVRDVQAQREYMKDRTYHLTELTIDTPSCSNSVLPSPHSKHPTLQNLTDSVKTVVEGVQEGDHVYIHFAGHGTQVVDESTSTEKGFGDLAWVLYDEQTGISYFYERQLDNAVSDMAGKGCFVIVVLDCCCSGSVGRHDRGHSSRTTRYDPKIGQIYPPTSSLDSSEGRVNTKRGATKLDVPGSFLDPGTYTILTACGPDERSDEIIFRDKWKTRSGALSHFLLRTLKSHNGENLSIRSLYNHLRLKFEVLHPQQSPMCYGRKDVSFLGRLMSPTTEQYATVFRNSRDGVLYLDRGVAHGVSMGEEFTLYPLGSERSAGTDSPQASFNAYISKVDANMSEMVKNGEWAESEKSESRWEAKPLSLSHRKLSVRVDLAGEDLQPFIERLRAKHFVEAVVDPADDISALFSITMNKHIESPGSGTIQAGETITVTEKQKLKLVVQNVSDKPLYVTVLVLQPTREINFLPAKSKSGLIEDTDPRALPHLHVFACHHLPRPFQDHLYRPVAISPMMISCAACQTPDRLRADLMMPGIAGIGHQGR
jgi:hypothetical protein